MCEMIRMLRSIKRTKAHLIRHTDLIELPTTYVLSDKQITDLYDTHAACFFAGSDH